MLMKVVSNSVSLSLMMLANEGIDINTNCGRKSYDQCQPGYSN